MKTYKILLAVFLISIMTISLYSQETTTASTEATKPTVDPKLKELLTYESEASSLSSLSTIFYDYYDNNSSTSKLNDIYYFAVKNPEFAQLLIRYNLSSFLVNKTAAKSAVQVSQSADEVSVRIETLQCIQNQEIISQNKQIIDLLTKIANKK